MKVEAIYAFMGGAVTQRTLGMLPTLVISGVLLYTIEPGVFTIENLTAAKETVKTLINSFFN